MVLWMIGILWVYIIMVDNCIMGVYMNYSWLYIVWLELLNGLLWLLIYCIVVIWCSGYNGVV